jgi:hypothetical protein
MRGIMKKLMLTAVLLLSACASSQTGTGGRDLFIVRVNNNLVPPIVVTVSLQPASGPERILGQAWTSRVTDLRYTGLAPQGEYRLLARTTDNRVMASEIMVLDDIAAVEWSLQSNLVTVLGTRNP